MFEELFVDYNDEIDSFIVTDKNGYFEKYRFSLLPIKFINTETDFFSSITPPKYAISFLVCFSVTDIAQETIEEILVASKFLNS